MLNSIIPLFLSFIFVLTAAAAGVQAQTRYDDAVEQWMDSDFGRPNQLPRVDRQKRGFDNIHRNAVRQIPTDEQSGSWSRKQLPNDQFRKSHSNRTLNNDHEDRLLGDDTGWGETKRTITDRWEQLFAEKVKQTRNARKHPLAKVLDNQAPGETAPPQEAASPQEVAPVQAAAPAEEPEAKNAAVEEKVKKTVPPLSANRGKDGSTIYSLNPDGTITVVPGEEGKSGGIAGRAADVDNPTMWMQLSSDRKVLLIRIGTKIARIPWSALKELETKQNAEAAWQNKVWQ